MDITTGAAKSILTAQIAGFLASAPYPFTHTLSAYTGCGFGKTTCGLYCYAQFMPNWTHHRDGAAWGAAVRVKANAAELLDQRLRTIAADKRRKLRVFMSSTTDPYQPTEATFRITRQCLEVFACYDDLDLLVIQTRSPLVTRDFDLISQIPYAWLSVTIETNNQDLLHRLRGGPPLAKRFTLVREARQRGINTQIAVSPCMPYTDGFVTALAESGSLRIIIDNCIDGDGAGGRRTAHSPYATIAPAWWDTAPSHALFQRLIAAGVDVGWSAAGFCGIPPRNLQPRLLG
jgi:DNA repair photolyase